MKEERQDKISRKEFIKKSSAGLLALGFLGRSSWKPRRISQQPKPVSKYRTLGRTDLRVTVVGYGASRTMEPTLVRRAYDAGINFFDTGRSYFNGQNEVMLGKVIKDIRKEVVIQSKISLRLRESGDELKSERVSERIKTSMQSSLGQSLRALQTDYIDVMLLHNVKTVEILHHETILEFFQKVKKEGIIRAFGFSTHANQVELIRAANRRGLHDVIMVPYNHKGSYIHSLSGSYSEWDQPALEVELEEAKKNRTGIVAMKACSAGPYTPDESSDPSYSEALKWILKHDFIHAVAAAMGTIDEIEENVRAML